MEKIYKKLQDLLDAESLQRESLLEDFEDWDSLCIITLITFLDKEYNVNLYTNDLKAAKTVGDLMDLIQSKLK